MSITTFLQQVEALLKQGNATEHSYRPALKQLFDTTLAPATATNEPRRARYGAPDFVIQRGATPIGHVEAKDIGIDMAAAIADSERPTPRTDNGKQLKRYRAALPNLLYTDGLEWQWFVDGTPRLDQPVVIARWDRSKGRLTPTASAAPLESLLHKFAAQQSGTVSTPRDLARRLAQIARWLHEVIERVFAEEPEGSGDLHQQLRAFRQTLLPDLQPSAFADMYAQTIVYGLFAARVAGPDRATFTRDDAARLIPRTNPFLRRLFREIAGGDLDDRIDWLVDDCANLLQQTDMAVVLQDFGRATQQEDPVVHFYETFLQAYDPRLRETRGVYYTPEPVVSYLVRSVDALLQTRFNMPSGLADERAIVLDPATGTATFLHAIIQQIHATLGDEGRAGSWNQYVPQKLLRRLFGFELLMAPYTVAHLKLGLLLGELGYQFGSDERLRVYLTNTIADLPTGQQALAFARYIAEEGAQANRVKQSEPVMVVIGNPPYSGHSANRGEWIDGLLRGQVDGRRVSGISSYYEVDGAPLGEKKLWLQDDYVKFIRFGQWRINRTGEGVLAFITNNGYLDNPTFRGMRQSLLHEFDTIYVLNLHGNSKKRERAPGGGPDENVFDIQQGVTIALFIKGGRPSPPPLRADPSPTRGEGLNIPSPVLGEGGASAPGEGQATIYYADLWGVRETKYAALNAHDVTSTNWQTLTPSAPFYLLVPREEESRAEYERGIKLTEVALSSSAGVITARDHLTVGFKENELLITISEFANPNLSDETVRNKLFADRTSAKYDAGDTRGWKLGEARKAIVKDTTWREHVIPYLYRPLDKRVLYYVPWMVDWPRSDFMPQMLQDNVGIITTRQTKDNWGLLATDLVCGHKTCSAYDVNYLFPLYLYPNAGSGRRQASIFEADEATGAAGRRPNLGPQFIAELEARLGLRFVGDGTGNLIHTVGPEDVFHYAYAIFHSPTYRTRYAEFLKIDFPRLPLTSDRELFAALATEGAALVDLHLLRLPGQGGVGGAGGAAILQRPGKGGVTFPHGGSGTVDQVQYIAPTDEQPGRVRINTQQTFDGIEPDTWAMQIGGYQPLEKWFKDRRGRTLSDDDVQHYLRMVIALRETRRIMQTIDNLIPSWPIQ